MSLVRDNPVSIGDLAPNLGMDRTTLTAYLKPLERRELVEVVANPEDARSKDRPRQKQPTEDQRHYADFAEVVPAAD